MASPIEAPVPPDHPIRRAEIHDEVEAWTALILSRSRGSGRITVSIEFDFKDDRAVGYRVEISGKGGRRSLTGRNGAVG